MSKSKKYVLNETPAVKQAIQNIEDAIKAMRTDRDRTGSRNAKRCLKQAIHTLKNDPISKIRFRGKRRGTTSRYRTKLRPIEHYIEHVMQMCDDDIKLWGMEFGLGMNGLPAPAKDRRQHYSSFMMMTIDRTKELLVLLRKGSTV
jgi:hypothetical protein